MAHRNVAADTGKGLSIVLVVAWHVGGLDFLHGINEPLLLLRMPLFFFVSGLFAAAAMQMPAAAFFKTKISNLMYLYVIWTFLLYLGTDFLRQVLFDLPITAWDRLQLFVTPPPTIWFIYALAIVYVAGWLTYRTSAPLVLGLAFALYAYSMYAYPLAGAPFLHKVFRALPFFLLALRYREEALRICDAATKHWHVCLLSFAALSVLVVETRLSGNAAVTLATGLIGIIGVLAAANRFPDSTVTKVLSRIGRHSFHVYVMHRGVLTVTGLALVTCGIESSAVTDLAQIGLAVLVTLLVGERIVRPYLPVLERAPWNMPPRRPVTG